jgi:hypothetical protein
MQVEKFRPERPTNWDLELVISFDKWKQIEKLFVTVNKWDFKSRSYSVDVLDSKNDFYFGFYGPEFETTVRFSEEAIEAMLNILDDDEAPSSMFLDELRKALQAHMDQR